MNIWTALAGSFMATIALSTIMQAASQLHLTRIDIPFLLGTAFSSNRARARFAGYLVHGALGIVFGLVYYGLFLALGRATPWLGAALGLGHALFAGTMLVNVALPLVHPRMGSTFSAANSTPLLEPPGFLLLNYGVSTPLVTIVAHVTYGAIIGAVLSAR